jgi:nucleotidyltransferase substrate binding protein (TIGR01987 family)
MKKQLSQRASERWQSLTLVFTALESAVVQSHYSELETAGLVQTFSFTLELCWKLLKDLCEIEGFEVSSPRDVIRQSAVLGIIDNADALLQCIADRNILTHTYNESIAQQAISDIKSLHEPAIRIARESVEKIYECN